MIPALAAALGALLLLAAAPASAQQRPAGAQTTIAHIVLPERPERSNDPEQETLALQMAETLGLGCRGQEMWRWKFEAEDFPRAQTIVNAGERAFRERGYAVELLPVEIDTVTAMRARLNTLPGAQAAQPDAAVLALWYVGELGVDLTLCRIRER
jgi:hypothetical protein